LNETVRLRFEGGGDLKRGVRGMVEPTPRADRLQGFEM
jgi:hypothetical protein